VFEYAEFREETAYGEASFSRDAVFHSANFRKFVNFNLVAFGGDARFDRVTFADDAEFQDAAFAGDVNFGRTTFGRNADFRRARFDLARELGPVHVYDGLRLDGTVFGSRVEIEASALRVSCEHSEFRRGAGLRLRWSRVSLEETDFAEPSVLSALRPRLVPGATKSDTFLGFEMPAENGTWCCPVSGEPPDALRPCVLSLLGSKVARFTVSEADLKACQFSGAVGLDGLRLERVEFPWPPDGWQWVRCWPIRFTQRQMIADECRWRAEQRPGGGWDSCGPLTGGRLSSQRPSLALEADQVAGLYRQLRKGREDNKDEPGANDFYYGEMEMRRRSGPKAERFILWLYWVLSGYGLRASRALLALAIAIVVLGAIPLTLWGFRPTPPYGRALLFSLQSSISLLRAPVSEPGHETAAGQLIEVFLRLAGPLLFGLAILALRGRIKR
jgi:Pentapeptide repeats (9 copies)